jgi:hypothetical protein
VYYIPVVRALKAIPSLTDEEARAIKADAVKTLRVLERNAAEAGAPMPPFIPPYD